MASEDSFKAGDISENAVIQSESLVNKIPEAERRRILRKIDIKLSPCVTILYLLSYLDRLNIGNAKIAGMVQDAHLKGLRFNIVCVQFRKVPSYEHGIATTVAFVDLRFSRNIIMKLVRPSRWIPSIMIAWGIVMTLMGLCKTFEGLLIARIFLGLAEAGLYPGVVFYLSVWYTRRDLALRLSIFFSAASAAGTLYPGTVTFLTPQEKQVIINMLKEDTQGLATYYDAKFIWQALSDYKSYILESYSAANAQLLSIPPYVVACIFAMSVAYVSDKYNLRGPFVIGGSVVSLVGFIILITQTKPVVGYVGSIVAVTGHFSTVGIGLAWAGSIAGGDVRKGVTLALVITMGNLGGVCSSFIYLQPPRFFMGHGICIGLSTVVISLTLYFMWDLWRLNKAKEIDCAARGLDEIKKGDLVELGSESPLFRYACHIR
ncbi:major facilitator superfamily domain-containing protein [Amanita rubescens]|nr:major facilitator superfamily domain-containing protein [Amanita rubescens]